jgi:hypothetical protein
MKKAGWIALIVLFAASLSVSAWPWSKQADSEPVKDAVAAVEAKAGCSAKQKVACQAGKKVDCTAEQKASCQTKNADKKAACEKKKAEKKAACKKKKAEKRSSCSKKKYKCSEKSDAPAIEAAVSEAAIE